MKKVFNLLLLVIMVLTLVACSDRQISDDTINVIFFTANTGATKIESYLDLEPNTKIEAPEEPTRNGFLFDGWYKDFYLTEAWDFDNDIVGEVSVVLYAKWIPMLFNIIYDANGGEMPTTSYPLTFVPGDNKVLPLPKRTGFLFVAWYPYDWVDETSTVPGDKGYQIIPNNVFEDLYLYAHWKAITVVVTFRTNYPIDGGPANPNSKTVAYGAEIDFPEFDDTALYTFMGWNSRADGTGTWYVDGEIFTRTQRVTVYGIWQPK
ncbi:MAG: hypothetical protein A2Y45_07500 [Tenericutes bacterium GWC2_34_14]|nr:MAG: hypothetical protein A2Z84_08635 [Tenericutes bacterium GWA2_35_7]OHE29751.1 MAG: hypothetical protein A2Y45_07500 [Tenericutes bacterium GWC2_34_14]OHE34730.1 MAG: hypothetical protein A2012_01110 [Tenericutes bacterium GWE2_34_108]OHE37409.1 MAG: hypothetical protein A2Y46_01900 [Tenericutes bacterium GWF1_35_14]OHE39457.1 MAG: hypothetical protein A2Y44_00960 [Tenericutes bacterium GWF2_35_184]OHE44354.1 MAG: hypothetical protein A2221_04550 [Tenericutes bacterium RIFOXYA2_FULL_36_3